MFEKIFKTALIVLLAVIAVALFDIAEAARYDVNYVERFITVRYDKVNGTYEVSTAPLKEIRSAYSKLQQD